jgi:CBS domain-containing protein
METGVKVYDAMTTRPVVTSRSTNLVDCAKLMAQKNIGSLIIKEGERFVGIITEQDIVRRGVAKGVDLTTTSVDKVMSTDVVLGSPNMDIFDALATMRDYDLRHLPIVDEGKLMGLVTMKDILKIHPDLFDILVEKMEIAEQGRKLGNDLN